MDIETRISARLERRGDDTELSVNSNTNNLDTTAPASERSAKWLPPVVRQIKIDGRTLLVVGKPIVIGSVDDPNSKRQFQLEVTVTKLALSKESACTFYDRTNNGFEGKCGTKKGDALNAYCTIDANKSSGQTQEGKEGKKLYQLQVGCLGV